MLKFSLLLINTPDAGHPPERLLQEDLEQTRIARDAGFDGVVIGQHTLAYPYQFPQPMPWLARLCAEAPGLSFATGVLLLPLYHPADIAEQVATLDALCGGTFRFGVGLGYRADEFSAFGLRVQDRLGRYIESIEVIQRLWRADGPLTYEGRHFRLHNVRTALKPVQKPRVPFWFGAHIDKAVQRTATLIDPAAGDTWYAVPGTTLVEAERQMHVFRTALTALGKPLPAEMPMRRNLYVAKDRSMALREARPGIERAYASFRQWGNPGASAEASATSKAPAKDVEDLLTESFFIGSPEDCVRNIARFRERLGITHFVFRIQWPGMPQTQVLRAIELFGSDVLPHVRNL
ncbi:MAG: LLM class flavin-dependent oxidoreductase [Chloroflexi bacterium]|nr:LLM class flavin-dependent oxidoreductase [Chloroflexota bacterium]